MEAVSHQISGGNAKHHRPEPLVGWKSEGLGTWMYSAVACCSEQGGAKKDVVGVSSPASGSGPN